MGILVEPIRPPSEVNPSIPKVFDAVVLKTLDRNQDRRYQNATELQNEIRNAFPQFGRGELLPS